MTTDIAKLTVNVDTSQIEGATKALRQLAAVIDHLQEEFGIVVTAMEADNDY